MAFPGEEVDEDFLIALAAAEAAAVDPSKRRRLSTTSSTASSPTPATPEGPYLAALKGSHSSSWQQQQQETLTHKRPGGSKTLATSTGGSGGACFKCGETTHWARDCPQSAPASGGGGGGGVSGGGGGYVDAGVKVEDKACPCGAGTCLVLTSNTARNPGRKFYKCPMQGGTACSFLKWCDEQQLKEQIQARSVSTTSVQSSTAQQLEGPKGQQSDLANMAPHIWSELEAEKLIQFCDEPSMKELYPDCKSEFCARLATKMNDHFGRREGYVPLDRDKIKEKLKCLETGWRKQLLEVEKGERQGFLPNIFDRCDTIFTSLFSAGEGTSSSSVKPKRERCPTPRDEESSIQYLIYHGFKGIELYKYAKALEDGAVLSAFVAFDEHTERMDFLQACADRLVKLP